MTEHVSPQSSPDRAALVEKIKGIIAQPCECYTWPRCEHEEDAGRRAEAVVKHAVEAAGWGPRPCAGCQHFKRGASSLDHRCTLLVGVMSGDSIGVDESFSCAAWEAIR